MPTKMIGARYDVRTVLLHQGWNIVAADGTILAHLYGTKAHAIAKAGAIGADRVEAYRP